jgi:acetyl-CoA carboxylase/biotin carboxylase 1
MYPNGISHEIVPNDREGVAAILRWLSYVPKTKHDVHTAPPYPSVDPVSRPVQFVPPPTPYDPRHMLAGATSSDGKWISGFFDQGTFKEYMAGWGKSVVVGRARLGGIPVGVISVETRMVEQRIPADPANPDSREALQPQVK